MAVAVKQQNYVLLYFPRFVAFYHLHILIQLNRLQYIFNILIIKKNSDYWVLTLGSHLILLI